MKRRLYGRAVRGGKLLTRRATCQAPDRDVPALTCGYPVPCPWHNQRRVIRVGVILAMLLMVHFVPLAVAQQGGRFVSIPDVSVKSSLTVVRAANSTRIVLVCSNTESSIGVRLGDDQVTATRGVRLSPGATTAISATSTIYGFSEGGPANVACSEEIR